MEVEGLFVETRAALDALAGVDLAACDRAALDALAGVDLAACDRAALDGVLARWTQVRGFCDVYELRIARRARDLAGEGRGTTAEGMLARRGRRPAREARSAVERERACGQMPGFETALADGSVSGGHVDGLAAATAGLDETARARFAAHGDDLLAQAKWQPVEVFARECRELARNLSGDEGEALLAKQKRQCRVRRWIDRITGMHHIHAELDPETGSKAWAAITAMTDNLRRTANNTARTRPAADRPSPGRADAATSDGCAGGDHPADGCEPCADTLFEPATDAAPAPPAPEPTQGARPSADVASWDQTAAQALVELLTGARTLEPRVPEVAVHIDWPTLTSGLHDHSLCETSDGTLLPPSTVRRLCCQAAVLPVVLDGAAETLDVGRAQRLANRAQRRALRAMYRTCAHPDCDVEFDRCEIHHVHPWELGGSTDLDNLAPLCPRHHHLVHEGGWTLRLGAHRVITLVRPGGTIHYTGATIDRTGRSTITDRPDQPPGRRRTAA